SAMGAYDLLYESSHSALAMLRSAAHKLEELARFDPQFGESVRVIESARADIEDVSATTRDYADGIDASPERLAELEDRLETIDRLKRKYGNSLEEVLAFGADLTAKLDEIENRDEILRALKKQLAAAAQDFLAEAQAISRNRAAAAHRL